MTIDSIRTRKDVADDLSKNLGTDVAPAKIADPSEGDTLVYAEVNGETQAYVADGAVQNTAIGRVDYVEEWGTLTEDALGATANQYNGEIADNVAAMYNADIAVMGTEVQARDESTDVDLEPSPKEPGEGFVKRALEAGEFR